MFGWARQLRAKSKGQRGKSVLILISIMICAGVVRAQETSGDLSGGAGIFRPKNPESKHSPTRPVARPTRPNPAEIEARYEDALSDGNDARDARKYAPAETAYRSAIKVNPRDARGSYGLGNVFPAQHRSHQAAKTSPVAPSP